MVLEMIMRWPVAVLAGRKGSLGDPRNQGWQEKTQIQAIPRAKSKPSPPFRLPQSPFFALSQQAQRALASVAEEARTQEIVRILCAAPLVNR